MARKRRATSSMPDQLRQLVVDSGLTPYALAGLSGVAKQSIWRWLRGDSDLSFDNAGRLASAIGVEPLRVSRRPRSRTRPASVPRETPPEPPQ